MSSVYSFNYNFLRTPEKTSLDDDSPDLCSLSKRSLEELTPAERLVRCSREIADGSYLVRGENTLKTDSQVFSNALKAFDKQIRYVLLGNVLIFFSLYMCVCSTGLGYRM